jgi:hypothetical protein
MDKILDWIRGLFSGGGGIISAVDDGLKVVSKGEDLVHDHNVDVAGQAKIIAADNAASAKVDTNVAKAAVSTTDDVALGKLLDGSA